MEQPITFDVVCRHVGRLYLNTQQEIDRLHTGYEARIRQLEEEVKTAQSQRIEAEREASDLGRELRAATGVG